MSTKTLDAPPMADKPKKPAYVTVKIRPHVHRKAGMVAHYYDKNLADYLSDLLEKLVDADYRKMQKAMEAENREGGK